MLYFLAEYFTKLEFLKSIYLRAFLAFVISFFIVLFVGKPFIKYLKVKKFGEEIRDDGPSSHFSKKGTPTMGGVLIIGKHRNGATGTVKLNFLSEFTKFTNYTDQVK